MTASMSPYPQQVRAYNPFCLNSGGNRVSPSVASLSLAKTLHGVSERVCKPEHNHLEKKNPCSLRDVEGSLDESATSSRSRNCAVDFLCPRFCG